jgi:hypothetical protein
VRIRDHTGERAAARRPEGEQGDGEDGS